MSCEGPQYPLQFYSVEKVGIDLFVGVSIWKEPISESEHTYILDLCKKNSPISLFSDFNTAEGLIYSLGIRLKYVVSVEINQEHHSSN